MSVKPSDQNADILRGIEAALRRTDMRAREVALRHDSRLVTWRNGKLELVDPKAIGKRSA